MDQINDQGLPIRNLVSGGAGFIGSHLCERLLRDGQEVLCVDNLATSTIANIEHLSADPRFEFRRHDVITPLVGVEVDRIFHLACPASPVQYQRDPIHTLKTSVIGSMNMLDLAIQAKAKVLLTSSSEVYGDPHRHPQHEEYWGNVNPIGLRACYDEGKRCAEALFFDYRRQHGLETKVVRIFNTYGPRMRPNDGRVVSNLIMQALSGQRLTVYGSGEQTRSFCYVDDTVEGLMRMMSTQRDVAGPINLGNPYEITVSDLAERIRDVTASDQQIIEYLPLPPDDPRQRCPDIGLARRTLDDWQPSIGLQEGLSRTAEWFRNSLDAACAPDGAEAAA